MKVTGVILAGGKSSRMGEDKSLLKIKGKTLTELAHNAIKDFCDEIIVSSNSQENIIFNTKHINDIYKGIGPMGGIYSALKISSNETNLVVSCDMPFVSKEYISFILEQSTNFDVCISSFEEKMFPFPGIYKKNIINLLKNEINNKHYKLTKFIGKVNNIIIDFETSDLFYNEKMFYNINDKESYIEALKYSL